MFPLYDTQRSYRFPLVTWSLIFTNVFVFLYELRIGPSALKGFVFMWGLIPSHLINDPSAEWMMIFTAMFLHGGWFHLLTNMWFLLIFGDNIEERMGGIRYLTFYLLSGAAAGGLQVYLLPTSQEPMIGASGAIAGIMGAYLILFPRAKVASIVPIFFIFTIVEIPAVIYLAFWFVTQLFSGVASMQGAGSSGVAWWAHIGGFGFGILSADLFARRRVRPKW